MSGNHPENGNPESVSEDELDALFDAVDEQGGLLSDEDIAIEEAEAASEKASQPEDGGPDPIQLLEAEKAALKDQTLRAMAEMENVKRRAQKQVQDERRYAIEKFANDLLTVADNLGRAIDALDDEAKASLSDNGRKLLEGVELTSNELHAALSRNGVEVIHAAPGDDFDPNLHQAVSQIPSDQPSGKIAQNFQTGYKIGDRILRAAMVAVSAGAS